MTRWTWLRPTPLEEQYLFAYRVRADAIMVWTNLFLTGVCLAVAAFNGRWLPAVLVGLPTLGLSWWLQQRHAGQLLTRLFMACAFMAYTSLLIHLSGGDIEAHFSAFGLIGVLLYYRDWRTVFVATVFIYLQHLVGGYAQTQGLPIYVFDNADFWVTLALHVAYFLPFVGMMGFLSVWLHREGVEQQRIIERLQHSEMALREATARAEVANRLKGQFLANMSHEIRTPLNGVSGMIELIRGTPLTQQQTEYLQVAQESSEHLLMLLNDILDVSRIEAGALELSSAQVNLRQVFSSLRKTFEPSALAKDLTLQFTCDNSVPEWVSLDPTRLRQICDNLVSNAIKYTPAGCIRVSASACSADQASSGARLCIEVQDSGVGIAPDMTEAIFLPFVQADSSSTRTHAGAGLGLAITRGLVQLMGGSIAVKPGPTQGACFRLVLPCAPIQPEDQPQPQLAEPDDPAVTALRILVAEDHPVNQKVIALMLGQLGHLPTLVCDGQAALDCLEREPFDLVLLDMMMPKLDGLQVLERWRSRETSGSHRLPIVMVTAYAMTGDAERFLQAGADGHLAKPLSLERLAQAIERHVPLRQP